MSDEFGTHLRRFLYSLAAGGTVRAPLLRNLGGCLASLAYYMHSGAGCAHEGRAQCPKRPACLFVGSVHLSVVAGRHLHMTHWEEALIDRHDWPVAEGSPVAAHRTLQLGLACSSVCSLQLV